MSLQWINGNIADKLNKARYLFPIERCASVQLVVEPEGSKCIYKKFEQQSCKPERFVKSLTFLNIHFKKLVGETVMCSMKWKRQPAKLYFHYRNIFQTVNTCTVRSNAMQQIIQHSIVSDVERIDNEMIIRLNPSDDNTKQHQHEWSIFNFLSYFLRFCTKLYISWHHQWAQTSTQLN